MSERTPSANPSRGEPPIRVLVVDADRRVRESLAALLELQPGLVVAGATGRLEAVGDLIDSTEPDVLVIDPRLPEDGDGLALLARLKARPTGPRVVVVSGSRALEAAALAAGSHAFLSKNASPGEFVDEIVRLTGATREPDAYPNRPSG